jgi:hypothetical protein
MIGLSGLAWLAIGEGVVIVLLVASLVTVLFVLGKYEPHFDIAPWEWQLFGRSEGPTEDE